MDFGGGRIREVTWYFAAPGAKSIPVPNAFNSLNWVPKEEWPDTLGEVWNASRPWSNGASPNLFLDGQKPVCAPLDWWENGVPPEMPDLIYKPDRVPLCCRQLTGIYWIAELNLRPTLLPPRPTRPPATYSEDGHIYTRSYSSPSREKINRPVGNLQLEVEQVNTG